MLKIVFFISFAANVVLTVVALVTGPSEVAVHFGAGGTPNGWAPAAVNALVMTGVDLLIFVSFFFTPHMIRITPGRWISLPNKAYWLKPENREYMVVILMRHLYAFGALTFAFMFFVGVLALQANLSQPVRFREEIFWWPFGFYMAYTVYWCVRIMFAFRIPSH